MALTIGAKLGAHEIVSLLGKGGMGEVYRARDTKLKREVAIKVLPEEFARDADRLRRFQREAEVLAALNHPNIAAIYDVQEHESSRFLVLEFVEGETLADRIARGPIPLDEALRITRQIADALEAAHEKGVVHRDLKPANIKITSGDRVKVLDFGLAKVNEVAAAPSTSGLSQSPTVLGGTMGGVILGTAGYMSPEQARGRAVDKRADVWAFGCVLYEMLTGEQLFRGGDLTETLASVIKDQADLSKAPPEVRRLLTRCLEKDPAKRLRDVGDAWDLIDDQASTAAMRATAAPARRSWPITVGVAVAAALLSFGVAWALFGRIKPATDGVQRLIVAPPENASSVDTLAISPDGRYLAMTASVGGKQQLWLRPLDSHEAHPVPASEDAMFPFWSPDSRFVAFFAQGKLKKAAIAGGPPQILCDAPDGRGGSWNRDGVIVFAPSVRVPIQRVSAEGGTPVDVTKAAGTLRFPVFLPDGRRFFYLVSGVSPDQSGIHLGSLDGKENARILPDLSSFSIAAGHLVLIRNNTLIAQPVDFSTGRVRGDAVPIADSVSFWSRSNYAPVTISESGVLVYQQGSLAFSQLTWRDRDGRQIGTVGEPGILLNVELSPEGKSVALLRRTVQGLDLWVRDLDRNVEQRLTTERKERTFRPVWSPAGDRIVFSWGGELYEKAANGAGQERVLAKGDFYPSDWSRDGRYLVLFEQSPTTRLDISVLPMDSSGQKPKPYLHSEFQEYAARLSPDSHWMAYTSDETGQPEVYVRPFPSGDGQWKISAAGGSQPRWRGDGKELFFLDAAGSVMAATVFMDGSPPNMVFRPGPAQLLFEARLPRIPGQTPNQYDVTSDGKRFLLASPVGDSAKLNVVLNWDAALGKGL